MLGLALISLTQHSTILLSGIHCRLRHLYELRVDAMNQPTCNAQGCICGWCANLSDDQLLVAMQCLRREAHSRAGVDSAKLDSVVNTSMDPELAAIVAQVKRRFLPDDKGS